MSVHKRNNVNVMGDGPGTLVFAHGFGCDQNMWRFIMPAFAQDYRIVTFDLTGSGLSDLSAYDRDRHATLLGHAEDLLEVLDAHVQGPAVLVGHSVSAMIGVLADLRAPGRIAAHVMIGPSPCYLNDGDYQGGFEPADIQALLDALDSNYLGWASTTAPAIMGAPGQPELTAELISSFHRADTDITRHFARVTFNADHRADVARVDTPTLVLQCTDDMIVPQAVGEYLERVMPQATLRLIDNIGHLPHVSSPDACISAIREYLPTLVRPAHAD
ncbi:alpha/beta hydrolase [Pseudomonas sp. dw_358]|uniref:alpha/beta fold hydrolase n=1 Tax=Pseudomonas sp. dw_358 TaxID=2720083 RepID=UPI001BD2B9E7|nr:alpha/beta hydrolase [Pseudomonas sp. dw_358]